MAVGLSLKNTGDFGLGEKRGEDGETDRTRTDENIRRLPPVAREVEDRLACAKDL